MNRIYLSLGSNLGDRENNIEEAISLLKANVRLIKRSSFYETEPVGFSDQPWFLNIAAECETALSPQSLLQFTQSIEHRMKRVKTIVNGPRIIDIDILFYENENIETETLIIPHPRMLERAFVLVPLYEISPDLVVSGKGIKNLIGDLNGKEIRKRI